MPADIFNAEQKTSFRAAVAKLKDLYEAMNKIHEANKTNPFANGAHALDHDLAVATFAHAIARRYSESLALSAVAAALIHSYDRHPRTNTGPDTFTETDVQQWVTEYLSFMSAEEQRAVTDAVLAHDKPNKGRVTEKPTTGDVLADGDKLANIMVYSIIRIGQFATHLPPVKLGNMHGRTPGSTYRNWNVVLDDVFSRLDWLDDDSWFVTPEAKLIAKSLDAPLRNFIESNDEQFRAIGLDELPI